jgi:hypothetical protein
MGDKEMTIYEQVAKDLDMYPSQVKKLVMEYCYGNAPSKKWQRITGEDHVAYIKRVLKGYLNYGRTFRPTLLSDSLRQVDPNSYTDNV